MTRPESEQDRASRGAKIHCKWAQKSATRPSQKKVQRDERMGLNFGRKKAASRVAQFMSELLRISQFMDDPLSKTESGWFSIREEKPNFPFDLNTVIRKEIRC